MPCPEWSPINYSPPPLFSDPLTGISIVDNDDLCETSLDSGRQAPSSDEFGGDAMEVPTELLFDQLIVPPPMSPKIMDCSRYPTPPAKDLSSLAVRNHADGLVGVVENELREQLATIEAKIDLVSLRVETIARQNSDITQFKARQHEAGRYASNGSEGASSKTDSRPGFAQRPSILKGGREDIRKHASDVLKKANAQGQELGTSISQLRLYSHSSESGSVDRIAGRLSSDNERRSISFEVEQGFLPVQHMDNPEEKSFLNSMQESVASGSAPLSPIGKPPEKSPKDKALDDVRLVRSNTGTTGGYATIRPSIVSRTSGGAATSWKSSPSLSKGRVRLPGVLTRSSRDSEDSNMEMLRKTIQSHKKVGFEARGPIASQIWVFIENPYSSNLAWLYSFFVPAFIVSSVIISIMQTTPNFPIRGTTGLIVQTIVEVVFSIELVVRFIVCPDRCDFWWSFFNYIDLVSTAPVVLRLYILLVGAYGGEVDSAKEVLTVVAVVPVLRLMKLTRRFEKFQLLLTAFQIAFEALPVLLYTMMLICLIFSAIIYTLEEEETEKLDSLPKSMWFILVTMTTVGYGDITPQTEAGHITSGMLMVVSALYMAMPIGIVGNAFSQVWGDRDRLLLMQRFRDAFLQGGFAPCAIQAIMQLFDSDGSGEIDREEFQVMMRAMQINLGETRVIQLFNNLDVHKEGAIKTELMMHGLFPSLFPDPNQHPRISSPEKMLGAPG